MSTAIDSFHTLHYSPYILSPIIEGFYRVTEKQQGNFLLSYLVLPLTLYPPSRIFLRNSNRASSLATFWREPSRFYGLAERVSQYKEITNLCIQLCVDSEAISINRDLSVEYLNRKLDAIAAPVDSVRAAEKLGELLRSLDVPSVYRLLGVKRI